jgi:protein involved in polysaccharide export with SLBB domain
LTSLRGYRAAGLVGLALLAGTVGGAAPASAQLAADSLAHRPLATRAELDSLAQALAADSIGNRATLLQLRARLADGDFQAGDRIRLRVEGQQVLSDTFTVGRDRDLTLPLAGVVSLRGVLRSELEPYLKQQLGNYLKYPMVRADALLRLSVQGAVARPGFYFVPPDAPLSDALVAAGGTIQKAKLGSARIERSGTAIWKGKPLQEAMAAGRTLEDAGVQGGDAFVVPGGGDTQEHLRFVWLLVSLTGGVYGLTRIF